MYNEKQGDVFEENLQSIMDLSQMLKYNLDSFKGNDIHKTVDKRKDMRPSCAKLILAINSFLLDMRKNCNPQTFNALLRTMQRDKLHDLSMHMNEMFSVDNVEDFTAVLVEIKNKTKSEQNGN